MFEALLLGNLAQIILHLLLQCAQLIDIARLGKLRQHLHIDDADLRRLASFFELLEQLVDLLQLFLDRQRLRHRHPLVPRELILGRQLIDLILLAQPLDHIHQRTSPRRLIIARRVPQPLQVANLLGLDRLIKPIAKLLRHLRLGRLIDKRLLGLAPHGLRFVLGKNLPLPLLEHRNQRIDARPQPGNLARIQMNRPRQLFFGQLAMLAEHEHVFHRMRHQIRRRLRRARKLRGVVPLIRMNNAAKSFAISHGESSFVG